MKFGRVVDATLMMDKDTGRPRGFGFVTFDSEAAVDACLEQPLEVLGKPIEVKKAQPRGNMREEEEARGGARGGRFQKRGMDEGQNMNQVTQNGGNGMAPGGMTPQLMAQYWQRMQAYFAMMQQQMAMGGGRPAMPGGMNPMMMQQMQAMAMQQQMQGGANGRDQSPSVQSPGMGAMNPQMQQQMMAMAQNQMQGMGGGAGNGNGSPAGAYQAGGGSNPGGNIGTPGYNAYEQQVFEQQKYEQQQMRRGQRDQSGYGGGRGGGGNYGGGPTSWEGMYDDVPQPNAPSGGERGGFQGRGGSNRGSAPPQNGPASAPPANAPTGPKNAGKPGANYRGGGRGGNRGFHPYAR